MTYSRRKIRKVHLHYSLGHLKKTMKINIYIDAEVYYNLHKKCLSVRSRTKGQSYGKVIKYVDEIILENCRFIVQPAGRARVLKEKKKNVHAFVRGRINFNPKISGLDNPIEVTYNPYKCGAFVERETQAPIYEADIVKINGKKITAYTSLGL